MVAAHRAHGGAGTVRWAVDPPVLDLAIVSSDAVR